MAERFALNVSRETAAEKRMWGVAPLDTETGGNGAGSTRRFPGGTPTMGGESRRKIESTLSGG